MLKRDAHNIYPVLNILKPSKSDLNKELLQNNGDEFIKA